MNCKTGWILAMTAPLAAWGGWEDTVQWSVGVWGAMEGYYERVAERWIYFPAAGAWAAIDPGDWVTGDSGSLASLYYLAGNGWIYLEEAGEWIYLLYSPTASGEFVYVEPGTFLAGPNEGSYYYNPANPPAQVTLTRGFYLKAMEVTKREWDLVRNWGLANGYADLPAGVSGYPGEPGGLHPVSEIAWYDVIKWLNAKSEMEGLVPCYSLYEQVFRSGTDSPTCNWDANGYRLPTAAEWEYACRAGTTTDFYTGPLTETAWNKPDPNLARAAWYRPNAGGMTHVGGQKEPNAWGLYDMLGNVYEYVWDRYHTYPTGSPLVDPTGPESGAIAGDRIIFGASINDGFAWQCTVSGRTQTGPLSRSYYSGFRYCASVVAP